jgi:hypothetical protein
MEPAGERDHGLGDVHPDDRRAARGRPGGHEARTGGDVEHARAGAHAGGVEERIGEPRGDRAEEALVAAGVRLPPDGLERVEGVRFAHSAMLRPA